MFSDERNTCKTYTIDGKNVRVQTDANGNKHIYGLDKINNNSSHVDYNRKMSKAEGIFWIVCAGIIGFVVCSVVTVGVIAALMELFK